MNEFKYLIFLIVILLSLNLNAQNLLYEGFENSTLFQAYDSDDDDDTWGFINQEARTGKKCIGVKTNYVNLGRDLLISPSIYLNELNKTYFLRFFAKTVQNGLQSTVKFDVLIYVYDGSEYVFSEKVGTATEFDINENYKQYVYDLSKFDGEKIKFAISAEATYNSRDWLLIDDISLSIVKNVDIQFADIQGSYGFYQYDNDLNEFKGVWFTIWTFGQEKAGNVDIKFYLENANKQRFEIHVLNYYFDKGSELKADKYTINFADIKNIPSGTYKLVGIIDPDNNISELNEENNIIQFNQNINYTPKFTNVLELESLSKVLNIYPSPAINHVYIDIHSSLLNTEYKLIDQLGKELLIGRFTNSQNQISLENINPGIYYLHSGETCYKIVKTN